MIVYHPGSGIPHNFPDLFPQQRFIAMNTAFRACRFQFTKCTLVKFKMGVIDKFFAFIARG